MNCFTSIIQSANKFQELICLDISIRTEGIDFCLGEFGGDRKILFRNTQVVDELKENQRNDYTNYN